MSTEQQQHEQADAPEPSGSELVICPYCGSVQRGHERCHECGGMFEPLSRQASQNQMGPWYVRDTDQPFRPGCNYLTLKRLVERGMISATTILRGPTTHQFWAPATRTPGVAHLLGVCHNCASDVDSDAYSCERCGAVFTVPQDRQHLGLGSIRLLPGNAPPDVVAESARPQEDAPGAGTPTLPTTPEAEPSESHPEPPKAPISKEERETLARQATRDDDPPTITRSANRRLRHSVSRMRWMITLLVLVNVVLLVVLVVALNPRLQLGAGGSTEQDSVSDTQATD
ncbi:MAG: hypothetical protein ACF8GE_00450 [Phycisphaerales bacterium JB043]